MDADIKKVRKLVKTMRAEGILHLKLANVELTIAPHAVQLQEAINPPPSDASSDVVQVEAPSPEALLFWSSPGEFPDQADQ